MRHKLLIIDDEPEVRNAIHGVLSSRFDVLTASSGEEGIQIAKEKRPDVILLDLLMGGMDGIATSKALRETSATRDIPIIMMTATNDDDRRADALLAGVDDLVSKPFRPKEFLLRILGKLRAKAHDEGAAVCLQEVLTCGNLTLDPNRMEATIDGHHMELTVIDMKLLRFFIRNKGLILSREQIPDAVWHDRSVSDRVVDNRALSLRKKLADFDHEIVSVYGAGYGLKSRQAGNA